MLLYSQLNKLAWVLQLVLRVLSTLGFELVIWVLHEPMSLQGLSQWFDCSTSKRGLWGDLRAPWAHRWLPWLRYSSALHDHIVFSTVRCGCSQMACRYGTGPYHSLPDIPHWQPTPDRFVYLSRRGSYCFLHSGWGKLPILPFLHPLPDPLSL